MLPIFREGLKLNVTVEKYIDKSFDLSTENILIKNLGEGLTYSTASQNFTARVRANRQCIKQLKSR